MTVPVLDPAFAHLADFDLGIGTDAFDLAEMRPALVAAFEPASSGDGLIVENVRVGAEPQVRVETFRPEGAGTRPALLWFHGGGYVFGAPAMDSARMAQWARRLDCVIASVDYRLAPDHPFPAAHEDGLNVLDWLHDAADELGVDTGRIVVGGASAGGGLAAGVVLAARDRGIALAGELLVYPMLDDRQETPSSRWAAPVWTPTANEFGWRSYLGDAYGDEVSPYAAPARTTSFGGLPPTMILVGGADGFFDEDITYATELTRAGVPTEVRVYAGAPHGFDLVAPESAVSDAAVADAEAWLAKTF